ncbi:hypothetical protein Tco_0605779 [Tanacetum coccineum]
MNSTNNLWTFLSTVFRRSYRHGMPRDALVVYILDLHALKELDNYDNESSDDDNDDDDVEKDEEDGKEEEHLAPVDPPTAGITEFAATLPSSSPPPENVESLKDNIRETMTTVDQGMSVEEIERVVAQRVANAIEAIAIYETKTNMARKSISQTEQQECKVAENANNKRKWEACYKCGYEYGSLGHFKSKCPIVKFQKRVDKKIDTLSERQAENKRELNKTSKDNQNQQQQNKRQNTGKAYTAGHREKKYYGKSKPLCPKCNYHHDGPCPPKCHRCNIVGHLVRNCRRPTNDNTTNHQRGTGTSQKANCYECGNQGHYKRDCPERKNQSHKNQIEGEVWEQNRVLAGFGIGGKKERVYTSWVVTEGGSLQKDDDDEISNLVDLHMGMLGGGWKWQDLQSLLWQNSGTVARFHCRMEPASVPEGNRPTVTKSGFWDKKSYKILCNLHRLWLDLERYDVTIHKGDLTIMGCIGCELLVGCGCGGGGRIHDDSSCRRDSVNGGARHGNFVRVAKDGDDNASN